MVRMRRKHKFLFRFLTAAISALFIFGAVFATITVPNFEALDSRNIVQSTKIYDRTGEILLYITMDVIKKNFSRTIINFCRLNYISRIYSFKIRNSYCRKNGAKYKKRRYRSRKETEKKFAFSPHSYHNAFFKVSYYYTI